MSDLVERLRRWANPKEGPLSDQRLDASEAAARITELETALAEALRERVDKARAWDACIAARKNERAKVIAEVVAWLRFEHTEIRAMRSPVRNLDDIATALETGEWKK